MYVAYYILREDGDADLVVVVEDGESIFEDLATAMLKAIEEQMEANQEEWVKINGSDCNFPDVLDLSSADLPYS